jgi:hypothetical protein
MLVSGGQELARLAVFLLKVEGCTEVVYLLSIHFMACHAATFR